MMLTIFHLLYKAPSKLYITLSKVSKQCHIVLTCQILSGKIKCPWFSWCCWLPCPLHFFEFHRVACRLVCSRCNDVLSLVGWIILCFLSRDGYCKDGGMASNRAKARSAFRSEKGVLLEGCQRRAATGGWEPSAVSGHASRKFPSPVNGTCY